MKKIEYISYAMSFAPYFLQNASKNASVRNIILFGSTARGDFDKESDIDIFIDTNEEIEKEANDLVDSFLKSMIYKNYWKLLGVDKDISIKAGNLDEWELKRSIISHGITLYGKYAADIGGKMYSMFIINISGKANEKLKIWRAIYGYTQKTNGKEYTGKGLLLELSGRRISPGSFIVPIENSNSMKQFLNKNKIKYKMIEMQTDSFDY